MSRTHTWTAANNGHPQARVYSLAATDRGIIFSGTLGLGVYRSTDNGDSWQHVTSGLASSFIYTLAVARNGDVFAGTPTAGVYRSTDNGDSWTQTNSGLTNLYINSLLPTPNGLVFAGTEGSGIFRTSQPLTSVQEKIERAGFRLEQNYPNPFNPSTTIAYTVDHASHVTLSIYDVLGRKVSVLADGWTERGRHETVFSGTTLPSGVYVYRLRTDRGDAGKRMLLLK